jgi:hypothetical protein
VCEITCLLFPHCINSITYYVLLCSHIRSTSCSVRWTTLYVVRSINGYHYQFHSYLTFAESAQRWDSGALSSDVQCFFVFLASYGSPTSPPELLHSGIPHVTPGVEMYILCQKDSQFAYGGQKPGKLTKHQC